MQKTIWMMVLMICSSPIWAAEYHVVQQGETLASIARQRVGNYQAWMAIANLNNLAEPFTIRPGQVLQIPDRAKPSPVKPAIKPDPPKTPESRPVPFGQTDQAPGSPAPVKASALSPKPSESNSAVPESDSIANSIWSKHVPVEQIDHWKKPLRQQADQIEERYDQWKSQVQDIRPSMSFFEEQWEQWGGGAVLIGLVAITLAWWFFFGACLRGACWFALVQTSLSRCVGLSFLLSILSVGTLIAIAMMMPEGGGQTIALLVLGYVLVCVVMTKSLLGCPWRSVLTVFVMSSVVSNLVVVLGFLLVFSINRIERLEEVLDQGVEAAAGPDETDRSSGSDQTTPLSMNRR